MPNSRKKSFVYALLASSTAASRLGPKTSTSGHASFNSFASPSTRGCSGPTTTIFTPSRDVSAIISAWDLQSGAFSILVVDPVTALSRAVPPFPGQQMTRPTRGERDRATARACSRPPLPTTATVSLGVEKRVEALRVSREFSAVRSEDGTVGGRVGVPEDVMAMMMSEEVTPPKNSELENPTTCVLVAADDWERTVDRMALDSSTWAM
mmetsp:Transcript_41678/g.50727  ORF Transcript_41678/g.50727 Transcript_41678/m.50727 type:complete len:209 (-) Transcript_41678:321-947(-)